MDACYSQGHQSSLKGKKRTKEKVFNQNFSMSQERKPQFFLCFKNNETFDRLLNNHKNNRHNKRCPHDSDSCSLRLQGFTLAIRVNMTNFSVGNNCNQPFKRDNKDLSQTIYCIYNQKEHFSN